jgi:hypothetical protein
MIGVTFNKKGGERPWVAKKGMKVRRTKYM